MLWRNSHYIDLLILFAHFGNRCQWGRSFRGFKGIWFCALSFVLKHLPFMLLHLLHIAFAFHVRAFVAYCCMVEYIEETPPKVNLDNICNEIQVHSHVHRLWGSLFYILWFY